LAGALHPLGSAELLATGASLAIVVAGLRFVAQASQSAAQPALTDLLLSVLPSGSLLMLGVGLSVPGGSTWAVVAFWAMLMVEEGAWWLVFRRIGRRGRRDLGPRQDDEAPPRLETSDAPPEPTSHSGEVSLWADADIADSPASLPSTVTQQLVRARLDDGAEVLSGVLRGDFAAGERSQSLHVAFCPPLERIPAVKVEQIDGPPASLKTAEVWSYGVRLDLRLPKADSEPVSVLVRLHARCAPADASP
jgi:hypothetical protein